MNTKCTNFEPIAAHAPRVAPPRRAALRSMDPASPAAIDEVFANLAARQEGIERGVDRSLKPSPIRATSTEMVRQQQRLAQLLRDIDGPASE